MVVGNVNTVGAKAVVAPTQPAGLAAAHRQFGRKPWRDLVAPAARLADEGIVVDWHTTLQISVAMADLARDPGARSRFLPRGYPPVAPAAADPRPQRRLPMPDLARTLRAIADDGAEIVYKGALARAIADDIRGMRGYLSVDDLAAVTPREMEPLLIGYGGRSIYVLPELNGGPTLSVAFNALKKLREKPEAKPEAKTYMAYATAMRTAWRDRFARMGDAGERPPRPRQRTSRLSIATATW